MATIHITEAELARDVHAVVIAKVEQGAEVAIERDHRVVAVLTPSLLARSESAKPGRTLSASIALAKAYEEELGCAPIPDEDYARDVQTGIDERRDSLHPPAWD